jgi:predicted Zn-dependent protease with MMP-like domain
MFPQLSDDYRIGLVLFLIALLCGAGWLWNRRAKKWLEEHGRNEELVDPVGWLTGESRSRAATSLKYSEAGFQEMVARALDEVPEEFDKEWKNVAVVVSPEWGSLEDRKKMNIPDSHLLLGMYSGIARTHGVRSESAQHVITIYQPAIEQYCGGDRECIERQVRKTVLHELAHHLGMSHERMHKIGL